MDAATFPDLNKYGNYEFGEPLPEGLIQVSKDGSIRRIKKAGIAYRNIVEVVNAYGNHYFAVVTGYAVQESDLANIDNAKSKPKRKLSPHPDLLMCIREASRAAHRERDTAQERYQERRHIAAGNAKQRKNKWYTLKDRGIVAAHKGGLVKYIGKTAQNLGVYEYGGGGRSCFHSTLHPIGTEQTLIQGHPEILIVEAKAKVKGVSLTRIKVTLDGLPEPSLSEYSRSKSPRIERKSREVECWECGGDHLRRDCPLYGDMDEDWEIAS